MSSNFINNRCSSFDLKLNDVFRFKGSSNLYTVTLLSEKYVHAHCGVRDRMVRLGRDLDYEPVMVYLIFPGEVVKGFDGLGLEAFFMMR